MAEPAASEAFALKIGRLSDELMLGCGGVLCKVSKTEK
jgi:hypothetical protein